MTDRKGDLISNQTFSFFISAAATTSIQSLAHLLYPSLGVFSQNWYGLLIFPHGNQHLLYQLQNNIYEDEYRLPYISLLSFILLYNQRYKKWCKRKNNHMLFFVYFIAWGVGKWTLSFPSLIFSSNLF